MKSNTDPITLRSTYPNGKYRPITKAQAAAFNDLVIELMAKTGAVAEVENPGTPYASTIWRINRSDLGPFLVTLHHDQSTCFTVYTRFEGDLLAVKTKWGRGAWPGDPNTYSGKWNVHQPEANGALEMLMRQLETVMPELADVFWGVEKSVETGA